MHLRHLRVLRGGVLPVAPSSRRTGLRLDSVQRFGRDARAGPDAVDQTIPGNARVGVLLLEDLQESLRAVLVFGQGEGGRARAADAAAQGPGRDAFGASAPRRSLTAADAVSDSYSRVGRLPPPQVCRILIPCASARLRFEVRTVSLITVAAFLQSQASPLRDRSAISVALRAFVVNQPAASRNYSRGAWFQRTHGLSEGNPPPPHP